MSYEGPEGSVRPWRIGHRHRPLDPFPVEDPRVLWARVEEWRFGYRDRAVVALDPPPRVVSMTSELVDSAPRSRLTRRGRLVRVRVDNCTAVYRVVAYDHASAIYLCCLARVFDYFPVPDW